MLWQPYYTTQHTIIKRNLIFLIDIATNWLTDWLTGWRVEFNVEQGVARFLLLLLLLAWLFGRLVDWLGCLLSERMTKIAK